ncbi:hypothetical protein BH11GEM2_BH11GEM2_39070 [soil metagenome]
MIRRRDIAVALLLASSPTTNGAASAQAPPVLECIAQLSSPTRDSLTLRVALSVSAVDREHPLPAAFQMDVADAIRKYLRLPTPLALDVYEVSKDTSAQTAHLALWGNYEATLTASGRMIGAEVVAGARNVAFDAAVLAAMGSIDSTDELSASSRGVPKDLRVRVQIYTREGEESGPFVLDPLRVSTTGQGESRSRAMTASSDSNLVVPLFLFRVPSLPLRRFARQQPGVGFLRYPTSLRQDGVQGEAVAAFIIGADGVAEIDSFFSLRTTHVDFARSVRQALPTFRFTPLIIGGCAVRSIVQQPFTFTLAR